MPTAPYANRSAIVTLLFVAVLAAVSGVVARPATAQAHEPDPAAMQAFAEMVRAYRGYPNLRCTSTVTVKVGDGSAQGAAEPIRAEMLVGRVDNAKRVVVRLRGFTCWLGDGFVAAVHESNPHAYYRAADTGSPYYALMTAFLDMPFPEFALAFGESDPSDIVMQLHQKAPWLRPTGVERTAGERTVIRLTSDHETATLELDPLTQLPRRMEVRIHGGSAVRRGTTLEYVHEFEHDLPSEPIDAATLTFDPGTRQRSDSMAGLPRRAPAPGRGGGEGGGGHVEHELVGKLAPPFAVPTLDGPMFEIAKQRGRIVVLDFWATWCGPCIAAMPHLHRIAAELRADGAPVDFYTINTFERMDAAERHDRVRRFWSERKFTLPILLDMDNTLARQYAVGAIPTTIIIDADGVVHAVHVGFRQDILIADIASAREALEQPVE